MHTPDTCDSLERYPRAVWLWLYRTINGGRRLRQAWSLLTLQWERSPRPVLMHTAVSPLPSYPTCAGPEAPLSNCGGQGGGGAATRLAPPPCAVSCVTRSGAHPARGRQRFSGCLGSPRGGRWGVTAFSFKNILPTTLPSPASGIRWATKSRERAGIPRYSLAGAPPPPLPSSSHTGHAAGSSPAEKDRLP